jgi:hypothetical protein
MQPQSGRGDGDSWVSDGMWSFANKIRTPPQQEQQQKKKQYGLCANKQKLAGGPLSQPEQQQHVYRVLPERPTNRQYGESRDTRQSLQLGKYVTSTSQMKVRIVNRVCTMMLMRRCRCRAHWHAACFVVSADTAATAAS